MTSVTLRASVRESSPPLLASVMDPAVLLDTLQLSGDTFPHEAMPLILPLLPLDARARAACVCRAWRAAAPRFWEELNLERCTAHIHDESIATLCARAGAALRALRLDRRACMLVTDAGILAALRDGGCTGLRRLCLQETVLSAAVVKQLAAACPVLQVAACHVSCRMSEALRVLEMARPRIHALVCFRVSNDDFDAQAFTQLAECLRVNTTLISLNLRYNDIGDAGATQLAECLRFNKTRSSLLLLDNKIGDAGAAQLAGCLRTTTTLTNLVLSRNRIGNAGAIQLAESLRLNATLKSLNLAVNNIADAGATQLVNSLRVNTTLTSLDMRLNRLNLARAQAFEATCSPRCVLSIL